MGTSIHIREVSIPTTPMGIPTTTTDVYTHGVWWVYTAEWWVYPWSVVGIHIRVVGIPIHPWMECGGYTHQSGGYTHQSGRYTNHTHGYTHDDHWCVYPWSVVGIHIRVVGIPRYTHHPHPWMGIPTTTTGGYTHEVWWVYPRQWVYPG